MNQKPGTIDRVLELLKEADYSEEEINELLKRAQADSEIEWADKTKFIEALGARMKEDLDRKTLELMGVKRVED